MSESVAQEKPKKVVSAEAHNSAIQGKINKKLEEVARLKSEMREISPVKQASLAECNALSRVSLKPQAPTVKIRHAQQVIDQSTNII